MIEMSMVASHLIWLLRTKGIRRRAKEAGVGFDDFGEGREWQSKGIDLDKKFLEIIGRRNEAEKHDTADEVFSMETEAANKKNTIPKVLV